MTKPAAPLPEPPAYLTGTLAERFREVAKNCYWLGTMVPGETVNLIAKYVLAENEYLNITKRLQDALGANDADEAAKWLTLQNNIVKQTIQLQTELGLSPSAKRTRGVVM